MDYMVDYVKRIEIAIVVKSNMILRKSHNNR